MKRLVNKVSGPKTGNFTMNVDSSSIKPSAQDVAAFVDTALQNPDREDFGSPFDGVRGLSTITRQKTSTNIVINDVVGGGGQPATADLYFMQWDFEPVSSSVANMFYCLDQGPISGNPDPGLFDQVNTNGSVGGAAAWAAAGLTPSIPAGGIQIYVMAPNKSPFPTSTPGVQGPVAPLKTISLVFDKDILHDCVRVLGSNHELVDTTNNLDQQGNCYQGAWDVPSKMQQFCTRQRNATSGGVNHTVAATASVRQGALPPGSTSELTKLNNQRTGTAKEGFLVMNRMDWEDNEPDYGSSLNNLYIGTPDNSSIALNGRRQVGMILDGIQLDINNNTGGITMTNANDATGQFYQTGIQPNLTIIGGVKPTYSAVATRTVTTQCFVQPASQYRAFAKMSHAPVDFAIMQRVQNTMDNTPMFWPNKANGLGTAFKFAKSVWNKAAPIVAPMASVAKSFLPAPAQLALNAAEKMASGPAATLAKELAKVTLEKDKAKAKGKAVQALLKAAESKKK